MMEDHEPQPHDGKDSRNTRIVAHFKDSLLSQLAQLDLSLSPSIHTHHSSYIQRRLQQLFNSFDTPTHPPYALMIRRAIMELNEGSGSTEEAISEFIRREYEDLPWAHAKILGLHLKKLCLAGELACTEGGRYVLLVDGGGGMGDGEETERRRGGRKRKRGKRRSSRGGGKRKGKVESCESVEIERGNGLLEERVREQIHMSELDGAGTDKPGGVGEQTQDKGEQACNHSTGRVEERIESEKGRLEMVGEQSQHTEAEAPAPNELEESQIQVLCMVLE